MKLPNYLLQRLDYFKWEQREPGLWVREGVSLRINQSNTAKDKFIIEWRKMSDQWTNLVSVDVLDDIIRTTRKPN